MTPGRLRQKKLREQRKAQGWREISLWLDPEASAALERLKAREPAATGDLLREALALGLRALEQKPH